MIELELCPCCGGTKIVLDEDVDNMDYPTFSYVCDIHGSPGCGLQTDICDSIELAAKAWNTRSSVSKKVIEKVIEELRGKYLVEPHCNTFEEDDPNIAHNDGLEIAINALKPLLKQ